MANQAVIIMLKNPVLGTVKTRLAKDIGDEAALQVYHRLLRKVQEVTSRLQADVFIFYSDTIDRNDIFLPERYKKYTQCSGDLGQRMDYAFSIPFKNEYKQVVMIGADCYALTQEHIERAFAALGASDFVIGPANDGGYYLIGMKKWHRWVLANKSWSQTALLEETKKDITAHQLTYTLLEELTDIDDIDDAKKFPELLQE